MNAGRSWKAAQVNKEAELERIAIGEKPEPEKADGGLKLGAGLVFDCSC
jgi:hypothetical protein